MQSYLEKFGANFQVAAFIPSLAFATLAIATLQPVIPHEFLDRLRGIMTFSKAISPDLPLVIVLTIILGFTLSSLNTFIYKLYEGYIVLERFPILVNKQYIRATQIKLKIKRLEWRINTIRSIVQSANESDSSSKNSESNSEYWRTLLARLEDQKYYLLAILDKRFPPKRSLMLPTRFGNILRASEAYPVTRYCIDAVPMWPRLIHVIPDNYYNKVEQSNNQLAFLINCSLLSTVFAILAIIAALTSITLPDASGVIGYIAASIISFSTSWLFYQASLTIVERHGDLIRSSYDLFRLNLLTQLRINQPRSLAEEQDLWLRISDFISIGEKEKTELEYTTDHSQAALGRR